MLGAIGAAAVRRGREMFKQPSHAESLRRRSFPHFLTPAPAASARTQLENAAWCCSSPASVTCHPHGGTRTSHVRVHSDHTRASPAFPCPAGCSVAGSHVSCLASPPDPLHRHSIQCTGFGSVRVICFARSASSFRLVSFVGRFQDRCSVHLPWSGLSRVRFVPSLARHGVGRPYCQCRRRATCWQCRRRATCCQCRRRATWQHVLKSPLRTHP